MHVLEATPCAPLCADAWLAEVRASGPIMLDPPTQTNKVGWALHKSCHQLPTEIVLPRLRDRLTFGRGGRTESIAYGYRAALPPTAERPYLITVCLGGDYVNVNADSADSTDPWQPVPLAEHNPLRPAALAYARRLHRQVETVWWAHPLRHLTGYVQALDLIYDDWTYKDGRFTWPIELRSRADLMTADAVALVREYALNLAAHTLSNACERQTALGLIPNWEGGPAELVRAAQALADAA